MLLSATDRAVGLVRRFAACFSDRRRAELVGHQVATLVGQRVFGLALGSPANAAQSRRRAASLPARTAITGSCLRWSWSLRSSSGCPRVDSRSDSSPRALDEQTLADTLEEATDLNEAIAAVVRSAMVDDAFAEGLKGQIGRLQERLQRLSHRADVRRQVARDAMVEADLKTLRAPDFTLSVRPGGPALVVTDERAIPPTYWQPREPRLDRLGLLRDLKQGATIEGVTLSNSAPVLSVRVG